MADAEKLAAWLSEHVAQAERRPDLVREELIGRCREERIEPPARARVERIVASALHQGQETLFLRVSSRLSPEATARLEALLAADGDEAHDSEPSSASERAGAVRRCQRVLVIDDTRKPTSPCCVWY